MDKVFQNETVADNLVNSSHNFSAPPHEGNAYLKSVNCCPHQKNGAGNSSSPQQSSGARIKYLLTFENTLIPGSENDIEECSSLSKQKCKAFWAFVDSDPKLKGLIKDGEFFHTNKPEIISDNGRRKKKPGQHQGVQLPTDKELMRLNLGLAEEHKLRKKEARERLEKRRAFNNELICKSGQTKTKAQPSSNQDSNRKANDIKLAASVTDVVSVLMNEMTVYDDDKIHLPKPQQQLRKK